MSSDKFCVLCLETNINLKNINIEDSDNVTIAEKLNYCVLSTDYNDISAFMDICEECIMKLNEMYFFKKQYKRNIDIALQELESNDDNDNAEMFEEVKIKVEKDEESSEDITQPQFEEVNVKVEPNTDFESEGEAEDDKKYSCNICAEICFTEENYIKHIGSHNEDKAFKCSFCPKTFGRKDSLTKHIRDHSTEEPFSKSSIAAVQ